jgi:predicted nucleic acid-binding protein
LAAKQVLALTSLYRVADETSQVTTALLALINNGLATGKPIHDANIVATCHANGIPRLSTHNVADFKRYSAIISVEPISVD